MAPFLNHVASSWMDDSPEISALFYSHYRSSLCRLEFAMSPKIGDKRYSAPEPGNAIGTLAVYRPSGSDRASRIAGMAEIGVGDRPGPRHIWRRERWWKKVMESTIFPRELLIVDPLAITNQTLLHEVESARRSVGRTTTKENLTNYNHHKKAPE